MRILITAGAMTLALALMGAPAGAVPQWCGGATGGAAGPSGFGGGSASAPSWARLATSKERLQVSWQDARPTAEEVLSAPEAIEHLRGKDRRPLLILRDCDGCPNKEGDLVKRTLQNERFLLGTGWFHCVRVDHSVLQPEHPLHELFEGDRPHHLLVSTYDGRFIVPVQRAGAKDIWKAMSRVLRKDHRKSPDSAMRGLVKLLSEFDALDDREAALQAQLQTKLERGKESRAQKIEEELTELREQREALFEREAKLRDLKPHPVIEDEQKG